MKVSVILLFLLNIIAGQRVVELGNQQVDTCQFQFTVQQLTSYDYGIQFRIFCNTACMNSSITSGNYNLFGTSLYSLDSDLCVAAVHDARLPNPGVQRPPTAVHFSVVNHRSAISSSFRRGLVSGESEYEEQVIQFTSHRVTEAVPDITTIHTHFRRNGGGSLTYLECHVGGVGDHREVRIFDSNGGPEDTREKLGGGLDLAAGGIRRTVSSEWGYRAQPNWFLCRVNSAAYSDTVSVEFSNNPYFKPQRETYRSNAGDNITLRATGAYKGTFNTFYPTWIRDGYHVVGRDTLNLPLRHVSQSSSGVFWLTYPGTSEYSSATRLIARGCPAGRFGPACERRCPFCLHGGLCHDVTGQCVCPPGFYGPRCQHGCRDGRLGHGCWSRCPQDSCGSRLLCVPDPYGCSCGPGWAGQYCSSRCRGGRYGPNCRFSCGRCRSGYCNRFTGECSSQGCAASSLLPPLCQPLWPWFLDPPTEEEVGYTSITVSHRAWSAETDNGFGSGSYSYQAQYRQVAEPGGRWVATGQLTPHPDPTDTQLLTSTVGDLLPDTTYEVRVVIIDTGLGASQEDQTKVPSVQATTDCAEILLPSQLLDLDRVDSSSASGEIMPLRNEAEVCSYKLNLTITSNSPSAKGQTSKIVRPSEASSVAFTNLSPFTQYVVVVFVINRKGTIQAPSVEITTKEAAPSLVRNIEISKSSGDLYRIKWQQPLDANGIIRHYFLLASHRQYGGCTPAEVRDRADVLRRNLTSNTRSALVKLKHAFSQYVISVRAFTVVDGPAAADEVTTQRAAPSMPVQLTVEAAATSARLSWQWPACTTWGDSANNIRLGVQIRGTSPWNSNFLRMQNLTYSGAAGTDLEGLTPFSNYSLRWTFFNSVGKLETPSVIAVHTLGTVPGRVEGVRVVGVTPTSVTVQWRPPVPPFSRITSYGVRVRRTSEDGDEQNKKFTVGSACHTEAMPTCTAQLIDLKELTEYRFMVTAYNDVSRLRGAPSSVQAVTEGKPGPPGPLQLDTRSRTSLNVSWTDPQLKNGQIRGFLLNVSLGEVDPRRRPGFQTPRSYHIAPQRDGRSPEDNPEPYRLHVAALQPGHTYLVSVAANTSAGYGSPRTARLDTLVAPPILTSPPRVLSTSSSGTGAELVLPAVDASGGPVSAYYVVVSTELDFQGAELSPQNLPNVQQSRQDGLSYYVAAVLDKERVDYNNNFEVGDGRYYNSSRPGGVFQNVPLITGKSYRLGVAVLSRLADDNQQLTFRPISQAFLAVAPTDVAPVAGVLLALAVLSILTLVGAVWIWRRRQPHTPSSAEKNVTNGRSETTRDKRNVLNLKMMMPVEAAQNMDEDKLMEDDADCAIYENLQAAQINYTRIELQDLVEVLRADSDSDMLKMQLKSVPHGVVQPCQHGQQPPNKKKNRYINLIAYDHSRVVLESLPDDEFSDYINANYIDGYNRSRAYIACQGPKKETVFDFWRMVWQEDSRRIVMLTNLVEGGKRKCDQYWPEQQQPPLELPGLTVSASQETVYGDYTLRTLQVTRGHLTKTVTHLHFTAWPDHSVPQHPSSLARFMSTLDGIPDGGAPTVVHCSAGVGRTGTVILIDSMYQMGRREHAVDVYAQLSVIRQQRANLCANYEQYKLVHQVLVALLAAPDSVVPATELASRLSRMRSPEDGTTERQWRHLESTRPRPKCRSAAAELRAGINRDPHTLPEDSSRVYLDRSLPDSYINAVYVPGFRQVDSFITTEAPLPGRAALLWQMVAQKLSSTVVALDHLLPQEVFWPAVGKSEIYTNLSIETKHTSQSGEIATVDLQLRVFDLDQLRETRQVRLLRLTTPDDGRLTAAGLAKLREELSRAGGTGAGPTVVVCRDGVSGCGLFVTVCFALGQLSEEQELDLVAAVDAVRSGRPQFITDMEQFELCYDAAVWWLEAFATYSNFQ